MAEFGNDDAGPATRGRPDWSAVVAGALVIGFGAFVATVSFDYGIGTARRMDSGYYPLLLGGAAVLIGVCIIFFEGLGPKAASAGPRIAVPNWRDLLRRPQTRAVILIPSSVALFALLLERVGLVPATVVLIVLSGLAAPQPRLLRLSIIAAVTPVALWLAFVVGLGLPFRLF